MTQDNSVDAGKLAARSVQVTFNITSLTLEAVISLSGGLWFSQLRTSSTSSTCLRSLRNSVLPDLCSPPVESYKSSCLLVSKLLEKAEVSFWKSDNLWLLCSESEVISKISLVSFFTSLRLRCLTEDSAKPECLFSYQHDCIVSMT